MNLTTASFSSGLKGNYRYLKGDSLEFGTGTNITIAGTG